MLQVPADGVCRVSLCPAVRVGVHGGGVGARVERAAQAGVQRAPHALQQERRHRRGVSPACGTGSAVLLSAGTQLSPTE